ncbi:NAD(P)-dependent dehydrogenase (short-subunit alcohol dehydrogenase family) [Bradyrhizobium sp. LM6.10]
MQVTGKVVVVTGGANGIGKALCEAFHKAGAAKVVVADMDAANARAVAATMDGAAFKCDVAQEKDISHVIEETERQFGPIELFCSNAGIGGGFDPMSENAGGASDEPWQRSWAIHVMAHVYAARHLIPRMKARGGGYFLNTISAAGLLSQVGSPAYSTTKHAAVGFAENLAISHKAHNIRVSILCPQGVDTNMLRAIPKGPQSGDGDLTPEQVAKDVLAGPRSGDLFDPAAPAGARLHAQEDRELRPLDRRYGQDPGEDAGRVRDVGSAHDNFSVVLAKARTHTA